MIPKVIYQTWFTKDLPEKIKYYVDRAISLNPSYDHKLYDDADMFYFIKEHYSSEVLSAYESLNIGAAKADLWRYLVLYLNGGIYIDMDSSIHSSLDSLIAPNDIAIISRERNPDKFVQWCLMFSAEHPILEAAIKKCVINIRNKTFEDILHLTGPYVFSDAVKEVLAISELDVYNSSDDEINSLMNKKEFEDIRIKMYNYDYHGFCEFKHPDNGALYEQKTDWRTECLTNKVFVE